MVLERQREPSAAGGAKYQTSSFWTDFGYESKLAAASRIRSSVLSLLTPVLYPLLPVGRFGGLIWLVGTSVLLPIDRPRRAVPQAG